MNGYQMQIDAYKQILESKKEIDKDYIKSEIRALEPFAERTDKEILKMFDSGAFNEVTKAYCKAAMENCSLDPKAIDAVMGELKYLFDTVRASEIMKKS